MGRMPAPPFLSRWVVAVCVVKFDIDEGQVMEFCHPPDVFDDAQARDISYLALPDSALAAAALPSPLLCRVACGGPSVGAPG